MDIDPPDPGPWWKRLGWFVALWAAGVLAVGSVAYLLRWWITQVDPAVAFVERLRSGPLILA